MVYQELEEEMFRQIGKREGMEVERTFDGMYAGQTSTTSLIPVPLAKITAKTIEQMIGNYNDEYEKRAGNKFEYIPVMGVNYRCRIMSPLPKAEYQELPARTRGKPDVKRKRVLSYLKNAKGSEIEVAEFEREELMRGDTIEGPAVIREPMSTTHILEGQKATIGKYGEIRIEMR